MSNDFPARGRLFESVMRAMEQMRSDDVRWADGKVFSLVFHDHAASRMAQAAYNLFFSENALNPTAFPSLRHMETDVIAQVAHLLGSSGSVVGNMTSGGTESILMAVKTARDWARATRRIRNPTIILPATAHPAFDKAAHYFDVKLVHVPVGADFRADLKATRKAINRDTIMLVGSAPSYPHGVIDPIADLADLAQRHDLLCHVDACVGGMMLPFVRHGGRTVPPFDFSVNGVTSLSVDLHKYGYAAKGASLILYRDGELRRHQLFVATNWAGGIYASPTMTGTRAGGAIAAAWAVLQHLGMDGYSAIAREVMDATDRIKHGINALDDVHVLGDPAMSVLAIASDTLDMYEIGDEMTMRGWHLDRQQLPPSLHLTINHAHVAIVEQFLHDLAESVDMARRNHRRSNVLLHKGIRAIASILPSRIVRPLTRSLAGRMGGEVGAQSRSAAMYGMMGALPNKGDLDDVVLDLVEQFTLPQHGKNIEHRTESIGFGDEGSGNHQ